MPFAARVADPTTHGSPLAPGIGSLNVIIGGMPAWRTFMDFHACPIVKGLVPDVGGVVMMGSPTVLINGMMACRMGDIVVEIPGGPNPILMGCPTVSIGVAGVGGVVVIPDDFTGPPGPNQMTQSEYAAVQATLERIARGDSQIKIDGTAEYKGKVLAALARLMARPVGRGLVNALDKSSHTTTIHSTPGSNDENAKNWNNGLYDTAHNKPGPGSDNDINWNADRKKIDGEPWQTRDPATGLGHEMVHSYHDVNGTTDGRKDVAYTDANGNARSAPGYEQQAAGVGEHADDPYTENKIRAEHDASVSTTGQQEPQRPYY